MEDGGVAERGGIHVSARPVSLLSNLPYLNASAVQVRRER